MRILYPMPSKMKLKQWKWSKHSSNSLADMAEIWLNRPVKPDIAWVDRDSYKGALWKGRKSFFEICLWRQKKKNISLHKENIWTLNLLNHLIHNNAVEKNKPFQKYSQFEFTMCLGKNYEIVFCLLCELLTILLLACLYLHLLPDNDNYHF